jgi:hypothetical protein
MLSIYYLYAAYSSSNCAHYSMQKLEVHSFDLKFAAIVEQVPYYLKQLTLLPTSTSLHIHRTLTAFALYMITMQNTEALHSLKDN